MERHGKETHVSTEEVSGGEKNKGLRWVLAISLVLAIVALTIIWVTGALVTPE